MGIWDVVEEAAGYTPAGAAYNAAQGKGLGVYEKFPQKNLSPAYWLYNQFKGDLGNKASVPEAPGTPEALTNFTPTQIGITPIDVVRPDIEGPRNLLAKSIASDIATAQPTLEAAAGKIGVKPSQTFAAKGMKMGGRIIAQDELLRANEAQSQAAKEFVRLNGISDTAQAQLAQNTINQRLDSIKMDLVKRGLEFEKRLEKYKYTEAQRLQAAKNWGSIAGTIGGAVVGTMIAPGVGTMAGAGLGAQLGGGMA